MKYIRLYEERLKDFEIMVMEPKSLIDELRDEIEKEYYDLDYIRDLVNWGHFDIDVIWRDRMDSDWTFLQRVSVLDKADIVKVLLEEGGADPNRQNSSGFTALHRASYWGHTQVAQVLLSHPNIDPNGQSYDGETALMRASNRNNLGVVEEILKHPKTDKTITDERGRTAWDVANKGIRERFPKLNPEVE